MEKVYHNAGKFIVENGTDEQRLIFRYLLAEEDEEKAVEALCKFQNEDGGWANGLEIEYQGKISSPMTTAAALSYIYLFGLDNSILLERTLKYLEESQNGDGSWDDLEEIRQYGYPVYYEPGQFVAYKTALILKWLRRLEIDRDMVGRGYQYLLNKYDDILQSNLVDFWTAIAYINAFQEYPHNRAGEIINWAAGILNKEHQSSIEGKMPWARVQGMIYDDDKLLLDLKAEVLEAIRLNQLENGGWPHQFGVYNQVWAAILILRFLRNTGEI